MFARTTTTISADLTTQHHAVSVWRRAGLLRIAAALPQPASPPSARHELLGFIPVGTLFTGSVRIGEQMRRLRPAEAQ